ncbi:MAG: hypothetical protein ACFFEE_05315 [Candidatus Thorarchaeota archaeon]
MSKKQKHIADLSEIFASKPKRKAQEDLVRYITVNSNLPGPRGNLELASAFEELVSDRASRNSVEELWELCSSMSNLSSIEAPVNDPKEFIAFCGTRGLGAIGEKCQEYQKKTLFRLQTLAQDSRWRMREAVAMALQRLLSGDNNKIRRELEDWIEKGDWLVLRGTMAGIAEPHLLKDIDFAEWALEAHVKVLDRIRDSSNRKSDEFRVLRKALGYTLSVVVKAIPSSGFRFLRELIKMDDKDIKWIVKENLKKKRLVTNFPKEVDKLAKILGL